MKGYYELLGDWEDEMRETEIGSKIFDKIKKWYNGWGDDIPPDFLGLNPAEACEQMTNENLVRSDEIMFAKLKTEAEEYERLNPYEKPPENNFEKDIGNFTLKELFRKYGPSVWERELIETELGTIAYNALSAWADEE